MIVIPGRHVHISADMLILFANYQGDLRMRFQAHQAVGDVHALLLKQFRPFDIAFLVKTCFQLNQNGDLFAIIPPGLKQCLHHR